MANENNLPTPVTSEEKFAAKAAGMSVDVPTPVTNMEKYLNAIPSGGGGVQIQADWNQTNTSAVDYIKNKPTVYTEAETDALLSEKADKATTKTAWEGTAAQYAALTSDDYDLYFVEEST